MKDKYNLTQEQNMFLAKKILVTSIYNSAKLEGLNTTFPETQTILEGVNVPTMHLDDINCILNLRDAWNFVLSNISQKLTIDYICKINSFVSRNESLSWGTLRNGNVGISGTDYQPPIPNKEGILSNFDNIINSSNSITEQAIKIMLYLMRAQVFWDGNKRTSMIVANKIMIENGKGIITIKEEFINEFNKLLSEYYTTGDNNSIVRFIYDNCIFGLEIKE